MTDEPQDPGPTTPGSAGLPPSDPPQTSASAHEDDLADGLGIDDIAAGHDLGDPDLPLAANAPAPRAPRQSFPDADLSRFEAASTGAPEPRIESVPGDDIGKSRRKRRKEKRHKAPWWELPALIIFAVLIAVLLKTYVVQPFFIPSASMERTLHGCPGCQGDRILVNKVVYDMRDPHPGDIVVFHAPPQWNEGTAPVAPSNPVVRAVRSFGQLVGFVPPDGLVLVKRVIATEGQTVRGDSSGNVQVKNPDGTWRTIDQSSFEYIDPGQEHSVRAFGPVTVPKGRLWVLGDHRNDSADSRYHCGPDGTDGPSGATCDPYTSTIPVSDVIGKAVVIAWPPSRWRTLGTPKGFAHDSGQSLAPALGSIAVVAPVFLVRRRRRRP
jgi:signal peptidase I